MFVVSFDDLMLGQGEALNSIMELELDIMFAIWLNATNELTDSMKMLCQIFASKTSEPNRSPKGQARSLHAFRICLIVSNKFRSLGDR